jgi:hypothetical protein
VEQRVELRLAEQARHLARRRERARDQRGDRLEGGLHRLAAARHEVALAIDQERRARARELEEAVELPFERWTSAV